ncbi:MAG TPA: nucleotide exchange factor GrpE [Bdellovibrionota bacterium]|nr:nucleotide exchange factor GrpE [Bdellovibrionota bacterium]
MAEPTQKNPEPESKPESAPEPKNPDGTEDLKSRIQELELQLKEKDSKYLYLYAEFDNYKKRTLKERSDLIKFGWEPLARELLQVVDNLERASTHLAPGTDKALVEGLGMVLSQLKSNLEKAGIQPVESLNRPFDPNYHEAVGQEPSEQTPGNIVREHNRGYMLHGRLLRPARVVISAGPGQQKT